MLYISIPGVFCLYYDIITQSLRFCNIRKMDYKKFTKILRNRNRGKYAKKGITGTPVHILAVR